MASNPSPAYDNIEKIFNLRMTDIKLTICNVDFGQTYVTLICTDTMRNVFIFAFRYMNFYLCHLDIPGMKSVNTLHAFP